MEYLNLTLKYLFKTIRNPKRMPKKLTSIKCIMLLVIPLSSFSQQEPVSFSMEEAKEYAMEHNKELLNAREDIRIADKEIKEAFGPGLPQVDGSLDYTTNFNYEFELGAGGGDAGGAPPDIDYSVLDQGDQEVLNAISQMMQPSGPTTIIMEDQANANVQVSQLIFSGQYWIGIQLAKIGKKLSQSNLSLTELQVKETIMSTYYMILISEQLLSIIDDNIENLEKVMKSTNDMYRAGMAEETDVDQIRVSLAELENSKKSMERNIKLNYNMFRFQLGLDRDTKIQLEDSLSVILTQSSIENQWNESFDVTENPNFQILESQEDIGQKQVKMQKWAFTPTVSGFYSYREKLLTSAFDLSPRNAAGLNLSLPIFSGGTRKAKLDQARIELDKTQRSKAMLKEQLSIQDKQLTFEYTNAYENYQVQKENVEVAKRVYKSISHKYNQGMVSSIDLTQANSNYLQAENNYYSAVLKLLQAKLKLEKLYNEL